MVAAAVAVPARSAIAVLLRVCVCGAVVVTLVVVTSSPRGAIVLITVCCNTSSASLGPPCRLQRSRPTAGAQAAETLLRITSGGIGGVAPEGGRQFVVVVVVVGGGNDGERCDGFVLAVVVADSLSRHALLAGPAAVEVGGGVSVAVALATLVLVLFILLLSIATSPSKEFTDRSLLLNGRRVGDRCANRGGNASHVAVGVAAWRSSRSGGAAWG